MQKSAMDPADRFWHDCATFKQPWIMSQEREHISKALESSSRLCGAKELYYDDTTTAGQTTKGTEYH
jgi:hypothetical protein